jgi:hypothetical protein
MKTDIFQKYPVLLCQGYDPLVTGPVVVGNFNQEVEQYVIRTDRGTVKALDVMNVGEIDASFIPDNEVTVTAGGQDLLVDMPLAQYLYNFQLGNMNDHITRVILKDAQTVNMKLLNRDFVEDAEAQLQVFYTDKAHENFLNAFKWGNGLGLKRRSYRLSGIGGNPPPGTVFDFKLEQTIPRQNGPIIGFSIFTDLAPNNAQLVRHDLFINGVSALENISGLNAVPECARQQYIYRVGLQPGSTFELIVRQYDTILDGASYFVTFYFAN